MAIEGIIAQLDAEISRLKQVRNLLSATGKVEAKITAVKTKPAKKAKAKAVKAPKAKTGVKRVLSPEARKAIADAQRKRWAAQKAKKA
jgi:Spy/CpxP family protein refolding chaperone